MPSYRQIGYSFGPPLTPAVKKLIIITGAAFVITYLPAQLFHWSAPFIWFGLTPYLVIHGFYIWQLVTYLFLHGGFFHILFNLFALWMFGADLERTWGSRRFLYYFFLTGIGGPGCARRVGAVGAVGIGLGEDLARIEAVVGLEGPVGGAARGHDSRHGAIRPGDSECGIPADGATVAEVGVGR